MERRLDVGPWRRRIAAYSVATVVPVLVAGSALGLASRAEAQARGVAQGRSEAMLVAEAAVEPELGTRPLSEGLTTDERDRMGALVKRAIGDGHILRLRLRDLQGRVIFSDDGSGKLDRPDDDALDAAGGQVEAHLTRLNSDGDDAGPPGPEAVEVYLPLSEGGHRVGVLEVYLPYAPIATDGATELHNLYRDLAIALALLYLVQLAIAVSVSRGLRRQVRLNQWIADHDPLTGLPNRAEFLRRVQAALAKATDKRPVLVAVLDVDRFKAINDTLGQRAGDELLAELAQRLAARVPELGTVARLGGDEFGIVVAACPVPEEALAGLLKEVRREIEVRGLPLSVEASIGYVVAPGDGMDADELLQRADVAMYAAKSRHLGATRYDATCARFDPADLALLAELREAVDAGQLVLHYQPKSEFPDGRVRSLEALVRWQHPVHGLLGPDRFIPLAEETDLIDRVTDWVVDQALFETAAYGELGQLGIAVNVSARSLTQPGFAERIADRVEASGIPAGQFTVEITETAIVADPVRAAAALAELGRRGIETSIDDFGQCQTSLAHLASLPVHELKIDRGFVGDMVANHAHRAIVWSIVDLAHNLQLRVVAEGVETVETLLALSDAGCDLAQGDLIARPMPALQLTHWLAAQPAEDLLAVQ